MERTRVIDNRSIAEKDPHGLTDFYYFSAREKQAGFSRSVSLKTLNTYFYPGTGLNKSNGKYSNYNHLTNGEFEQQKLFEVTSEPRAIDFGEAFHYLAEAIEDPLINEILGKEDISFDELFKTVLIPISEQKSPALESTLKNAHGKKDFYDELEHAVHTLQEMDRLSDSVCIVSELPYEVEYVPQPFPKKDALISESDEESHKIPIDLPEKQRFFIRQSNDRNGNILIKDPDNPQDRETGLLYKGRCDQVRENSDGTLTSIDFKTSKYDLEPTLRDALQQVLHGLALQFEWKYIPKHDRKRKEQKAQRFLIPSFEIWNPVNETQHYMVMENPLKTMKLGLDAFYYLSLAFEAGYAQHHAPRQIIPLSEDQYADLTKDNWKQVSVGHKEPDPKTMTKKAEGVQPKHTYPLDLIDAGQIAAVGKKLLKLFDQSFRWEKRDWRTKDPEILQKPNAEKYSGSTFRWDMAGNSPKEQIANLVPENDPSEVLRIILRNRGLDPFDDYSEYFFPSPEHIRVEKTDLDLEQWKKTLDILSNSLMHGDKFVLIGHNDVDGNMSTFILSQSLYELWGKVQYTIPSKEDTNPITEQLLENILNIDENKDAKVIIFLDRGTNAYDAIKYAHDRNIKVIILDHHISKLSQGEQHPADGILHSSKLCTSQIAYIVSRELGAATDNYLDLAGFAGFADMTSFQGTGRVFSKLVYDRIMSSPWTQEFILPIDSAYQERKRNKEYFKLERNGLLTPAKKAEVKEKVYAGPDITEFIRQVNALFNAAGRMGKPGEDDNIVIQSLTEPDDNKRAALQERLFVLNNLRAKSTDEGLRNLRYLMRSKEKITEDNPIAFITASPGIIDSGVVNLAALRLAGDLGKPTLIATEHKNKRGDMYFRITGRVDPYLQPDYNLYNAMEQAARRAGIFSVPSGHDNAAAITIYGINDLHAFKENLFQFAREHASDLRQSIRIERVLPLNERVIKGLIGRPSGKLYSMEPFGPDNQEPHFLARDVKVKSIKQLWEGSEDITMKLFDHAYFTIGAIGYGMAEKIKELGIEPEDEVDLVFKLGTWQNSDGDIEPQLVLKDIMLIRKRFLINGD